MRSCDRPRQRSQPPAPRARQRSEQPCRARPRPRSWPARARRRARRLPRLAQGGARCLCDVGGALGRSVHSARPRPTSTRLPSCSRRSGRCAGAHAFRPLGRSRTCANARARRAARRCSSAGWPTGSCRGRVRDLSRRGALVGPVHTREADGVGISGWASPVLRRGVAAPPPASERVRPGSPRRPRLCSPQVSRPRASARESGRLRTRRPCRPNLVATSVSPVRQAASASRRPGRSRWVPVGSGST